MEAIVFCGIQGSGKSTFYRDCFFHTHVRINLDMLKTRHRERVLLQACLSAQQPFVIDNTNVRAAERAAYIEPARAAGFRVLCYFFDSDLRAAIARNKLRSGKAVIPVPGLIGTWKRLERPERTEGFDELFVVTIAESGEWDVQPAA